MNKFDINNHPLVIALIAEEPTLELSYSGTPSELLAAADRVMQACCAAMTYATALLENGETQ